jgi:hypothetical protein
MSLSIETRIKKWIDYDNQIKEENEKLKELRDKRNELNDEIINYSKSNNMMSAIFELSDSKIKFVTTKTQQPLSLKYIETCLGSIIKDEGHVTKIMEYIKHNRDNKETVELKRIFNK